MVSTSSPKTELEIRCVRHAMIAVFFKDVLNEILTFEVDTVSKKERSVLESYAMAAINRKGLLSYIFF